MLTRIENIPFINYVAMRFEIVVQGGDARFHIIPVLAELFRFRNV